MYIYIIHSRPRISEAAPDMYTVASIRVITEKLPGASTICTLPAAGSRCGVSSFSNAAIHSLFFFSLGECNTISHLAVYID